jgi:Na+/H+ antiporter NhaD/arsenite permease-like protein
VTDLTETWVGYIALAGFIFAYVIVVLEGKLEIHKSKPMIVAGCFLWGLIGIYELQQGQEGANEFIKTQLGEIAELFFFLLAAMTYINTLDERNVFQKLRAWMLQKRFGFKGLFWVSGTITFLLSPVVDNLTSALLMSTVMVAISGNNTKFLVPTLVNIVVAANAGGAWSPCGDITTLMVWTSGKVQTHEFFYLIIPSVINWLIPALIMSRFIPDGKPSEKVDIVILKPGSKTIMVLGILTIAMAMGFHHFLHLPPYLGMMLGLSLLMIEGYYLKQWGDRQILENLGVDKDRRQYPRFDIFTKVGGIQFDTLLFIFGILTAVGALQYIGYLSLINYSLYENFGPTASNIVLGFLSAAVDNIPVMFAVIKMNPSMNLDQWLLITLTTGVGGSLLSLGSAAGIAVMGVSREHYTFTAHLKWTPAIAVGYFASIFVWWLLTQKFLLI